MTNHLFLKFFFLLPYHPEKVNNLWILLLPVINSEDNIVLTFLIDKMREGKNYCPTMY